MTSRVELREQQTGGQAGNTLAPKHVCAHVISLVFCVYSLISLLSLAGRRLDLSPSFGVGRASGGVQLSHRSRILPDLSPNDYVTHVTIAATTAQSAAVYKNSARSVH